MHVVKGGEGPWILSTVSQDRLAAVRHHQILNGLKPHSHTLHVGLRSSKSWRNPGWQTPTQLTFPSFLPQEKGNVVNHILIRKASCTWLSLTQRGQRSISLLYDVPKKRSIKYLGYKLAIKLFLSLWSLRATAYILFALHTIVTHQITLFLFF